MLGFIKSATTRALRSPPAASDQTTGAVGAGVPNDTTVAQESTLAKVESGTSTAGTVSKSSLFLTLQIMLLRWHLPSPVHGQDPTFLTPNEQLGSSFEEASNHSGQPTSDKDLGRFSFLSLPFLRSESKLPAQSEHKSTNRSQSYPRIRLAGTEKRVKESAMLVRSIIVGDCNSSLGAKPVKTSSTAKSAVRRVHSHLSKPKSASKVCLDVTDDEAHERYFSKLGSVASASVAAVSDALRDVHIVHLLAAPNMGFGAPATASGVFAGAVPTAGAVLEGIQEITPQLLALGYATGKAIHAKPQGL
ncbi:hypothetical protein F5141DRAFT_1211245 [Pisolithus sp. B1]|nr:hypothetical protein F5141DRAFT_1211245 [Pisolithus sp. B1]